MKKTYYHIIFPRGDKNTLSIAEFSDADHHELSQYAVASRKEFTDKAEAVDYMWRLATNNGLNALFKKR